MSKKEFIKHLQSILKLLKKEQKVLEKNDGDALLEIIEKKNTYIEGLEKFKGIDLDDEKIMDLIGEIDSLQELNLLLTRQALSFQENFLASLKKAAKTSNTYSNIGGYGKSSSTSIVEKEI